jgi:hypothetical protein
MVACISGCEFDEHYKPRRIRPRHTDSVRPFLSLLPLNFKAADTLDMEKVFPNNPKCCYSFKGNCLLYSADLLDPIGREPAAETFPPGFLLFMKGEMYVKVPD